MDTTASWNGDRRFQRWLGGDESVIASVEARVVFSDPEKTNADAAPFVLGITRTRLLALDCTDAAQSRLDASIPLDYLLRVWLEEYEESTDLVVRLTTGAHVRFEVSGSDLEAAAAFCQHAAELADAADPTEPATTTRERVLVGATAHVSADGSDGYFLRVDRPDPPAADLSSCRHCGRHVRSDAVFCGWCGTIV